MQDQQVQCSKPRSISNTYHLRDYGKLAFHLSRLHSNASTATIYQLQVPSQYQKKGTDEAAWYKPQVLSCDDT